MAYYALQGTKGSYMAPKSKGEDHKVWLEDYAKGPNEWMSLSELFHEFLPEELIDIPDEAKDSGHHGADYFMVKDFVDCIYGNKTVAIDVYKALECTLPGILSEKSIIDGGSPMIVPDVRAW